MQAVRILLENGAVIDQTDSEGRTALWRCADQEMSTTLVQHGASLVDHFRRNILDILQWDTEVFMEMGSSYSDTITEEDPSQEILGWLRTIYGTRGSIDCQKVTMGLDQLASILKADIDLNQELGSGRSLMHLAIIDRASATFILNSNLSLETMTPFPWHLEFWSNPSFLNSLFRHFQRKLTEEELARIAHLQPVRGLSPLCHASVNGNMDMIRNCLSLGADVDFEGSPHGSALIVASACGNMEAVRILVRAGGESLIYRTEGPQKCLHLVSIESRKAMAIS